MTEPQEITLGNYLKVMRQQRWLILFVAVICAAAGLGLSLIQRPNYVATAALSVQDPNADLGLLGGAFVSGQTPQQLALQHVPQTTRQEVLQRVRRDLRSNLSPDQLRASVDVHVDPNSNLVLIDAHSERAADAAAIANAFARADTALTMLEVRRSYARAAAQLVARHGGARRANQATQAVYLDELSRLQSLSTVASPLAVSETARAPSTPSSPQPVRNTLAAAILGLLLGVAIAYGRDSLDLRLRTTSDIEQQFDYPMLGNIRSEALGAANWLSVNGTGELQQADQESFRILRQNVQYLAVDHELRSLLVTSAMPQEGKSTVAACLAVANAVAGRRTLLIGCDLRRPVLAERFGLAGTPGLTDYLTGNAEPHEIMQYVAAIPRGRNGNGELDDRSAPASEARLVCITSGTEPPRPAELLASLRFQTFLAEVTQVYDAVILDSPPLLAVADTLEMVPHVAGVLVCVRVGQTTRDQARGVRATLGRLPEKPTGIVLTDVRAKDEGYYGYYGALTEA